MACPSLSGNSAAEGAPHSNRSIMTDLLRHASAILASYQRAEAELVGKVVVLTDGKAGTVEGIWLDELHGLRISIGGHFGKWPLSSLKMVSSEPTANHPNNRTETASRRRPKSLSFKRPSG
jgi:hypothetical protein